MLSGFYCMLSASPNPSDGGGEHVFAVVCSRLFCRTGLTRPTRPTCLTRPTSPTCPTKQQFTKIVQRARGV